MTIWPETRDVTAPDTIDLLTDLRALRYLRPFLRDEHTLTSAATSIGRAPSTLAYWIPRFLRADLLQRIGTTSRAGMAMPRYRATAKQFTVRLAAIPLDRRIALLDEGRLRVMRHFLDGMDEALQTVSDVSLGFSCADDGGTAIRMIEPQPVRVHTFTDGWITLRLSDQEAVAFADELEALSTKYGGRTSGRAYIAHIGLAPEPRFRWRSADDDHL